MTSEQEGRLSEIAKQINRTPPSRVVPFDDLVMSEVVDDRHRPISRRRTRGLATRHRVVQPDPPPIRLQLTEPPQAFPRKPVRAVCPSDSSMPWRCATTTSCRCPGKPAVWFECIPSASTRHSICSTSQDGRSANTTTISASWSPPPAHFDKAAAEAAIKKAVHATGATRPEVTVTVVNAIPPAPPADVPWLSHPLVHPAISDGKTSGRCAGLERPRRRSEISSLWGASDGRQPSLAAVQRSVASCRSRSTPLD